MPTYEYACTSCGNEWEAEQSIKEDALRDCPACKGPTAKRQISRGTGFILKGSGWYSDLYSGSSNKKDSSTPSSSTTTESSTTSSTPAASTPAAAAPAAGSSSGGSSSGST